LENNAEVQAKEQWMIYFSWENVFSGYVDTNLESPFEEINGKKYYKTWDLWYLDEEWYLFITWRLKRFIKIAWEMISLPFIEWILNKKYWSNLAIEAREENFNVKIVLFSSENLDLDEIQLYLRQNGVSNLVKINGLVKLESIPVLWTWKIDYKELKNMISFEEKSINFDFSDLEWGIIKKIALLSKIDEKRINLESEFWKDIYLDSIDVWELMVFIKNNFKVYKNIEINNIKNVKDLIDNIK
jgi:acyl carrier protein